MNKLVKIDGKYYVETSYLHHAEPKRCFVRWRVIEYVGGGLIPDPIPDFDVRHMQTANDLSSFSLYCGNGRYLTLVTPKYGEASEQPVPPPKVKATTETRWDMSLGWQKYDKRKGWICA